MSFISQAYTKIASGASAAGTFACGVVEKGCAPLGGRVISILSSYGVRMPKILGSVGFLSQPALVGVAVVIAAVMLSRVSMNVASSLNTSANKEKKAALRKQHPTGYTATVIAKKAVSLTLMAASVATSVLLGYQLYKK